MSFSQPYAEARNIIAKLQEDKTDGKDGGGSSPVLNGGSQEGGEMTMRRTTPKTKTNSLRRSG